jgi:hypothetical protein
MSKIIEYPAKKVNRKKKAITAQGKAVTVPPERGALVQSRTVLPKSEPKDTGKQWTAMSAPAPMWDRPNVIGVNEPGVSTAEPITKPHIAISKETVPDPKIAKKHPATKKTITLRKRHAGMVDQMIPGFENVDKPEPKEFMKPRKLIQVEGPLTSAQLYAEKQNPNPTSNVLKQSYGKVMYGEPVVKKTVPTVSSQLAKIPGNSPVDQPVENTTKVKGTVRVYGTKKMVPAPEAPKKAEKIKANPEQLAFPGSYPAEGAEGPAIPGMEDVSSTHAGGQQWLKPRQLGSETLNLQGKSRTAGVPGGMSPTNVERGTEPAKSNRSFKNKR